MLIKTYLLITMLCQDLTFCKNFFEKLAVLVISIVFAKGQTIFTVYNLGSPDVWGPGSEP